MRDDDSTPGTTGGSNADAKNSTLTVTAKLTPVTDSG